MKRYLVEAVHDTLNDDALPLDINYRVIDIRLGDQSPVAFFTELADAELFAAAKEAAK